MFAGGIGCFTISCKSNYIFFIITQFIIRILLFILSSMYRLYVRKSHMALLC